MIFDYRDPDNPSIDCRNKGGIYKITNYCYNPPKFYIGQTHSFSDRWLKYKLQLNKNKESRYLSNDYKKCLALHTNDDFQETIIYYATSLEKLSKENISSIEVGIC